MEKNITNRRRRIVFSVAADILLICCIVFFIVPKLNVENNPVVMIREEPDGGTTIYITAGFLNRTNWYLYALMFIMVDLILVSVIQIVEYAKNRKLKYGIPFIVFFNLIMPIIVLPGTLLLSILLNMAIIMVFTIKYFSKRKSAAIKEYMEKNIKE